MKARSARGLLAAMTACDEKVGLRETVNAQHTGL